MTTRRRILYYALAGAVGGLLGWLVAEAFASPETARPPIEVTLDSAPPPHTTLSEAIIGQMPWAALIGLWIGMALGAFEGLVDRSPKRLLRGAAVSGAVGVVAGSLGVAVAQTLFSALLGPHPSQVLLPFVLRLIVARTIGWGLFGAAIGTCLGASWQSARRALMGVIGGAIGGCVGGAMFDLVGFASATGVASRGIGVTSLGGLVGLGMALAEDVAKQAWLHSLSGSNEGREYILDKPVTTLGRDELSDVGLFGDTSVAPRHALIRRQNGHWVLEAAQGRGATLVNDQPMTQVVLQEGDIIRLGNRRLAFHLRGAESLIPADIMAILQAAQAQRSAPSQPAPLTGGGDICPYCGTPKDPLTGACACTPGSAMGPPPRIGQPSAPQPPPAPSGPPPLEMQPAAILTDIGMPQAPVGFPTAPGAAGTLRLVGIEGPLAGRIISLATPATIGRDPSLEIVVPEDPTVSRRHVRLSPTPSGCVIEDLGSLNGTWVDGVRVSQTTLFPGQTVQVGRSRLRVEMG
jgi:pSer/pThr/pTyr-binding forkhead associated (FHA) protein